MLKVLVIMIIITHVDMKCKVNDDKLVLSPVELIDLLRKEQHKCKVRNIQEMDFPVAENDVQGAREDASEAESCEDENTLKKRKVWSRWSKWSQCSVTCGSGVITRQRSCVSGRCAPGEREEQRRPCDRSPCAGAGNATEDLHDAE